MTPKAFLLVLLLYPSIDAANYCALTCPIGGGKSSGCDCSDKKGCKELKLNGEEQLYVVKVHNELRNQVASGEIKEQGLKTASNMMVLSYDANLEYVANCWAKRCSSDHDACRRTEKFPTPGQNFFSRLGKTNCGSKDVLKEAALMWFSEVRDATPACIQASGTCNKIVGHFTQMIWADTTSIGCGRVKFDDGTCNVFCNYGPGGNVMQMPVYKPGAPASECPDKVVNSEFKSLCGEQSDASARSSGTVVECVQKSVLIVFTVLFVFRYMCCN